MKFEDIPDYLDKPSIQLNDLLPSDAISALKENHYRFMQVWVVIISSLVNWFIGFYALLVAIIKKFN
ncbi:hypothetical protein BH09BAC6_BH09BAC6_11110 [soil metagenome]|jgi:hypothetical protein